MVKFLIYKTFAIGCYYKKKTPLHKVSALKVWPDFWK